MCELLWSDPHPGTGRAPSKRGVGVAFGSDVTNRFLEDNNLGLSFLEPYMHASCIYRFVSSTSTLCRYNIFANGLLFRIGGAVT